MTYSPLKVLAASQILMSQASKIIMKSINDLVIHVSTVNGSGSQSSNSLLARAFFKMGLSVGAKNLFPSNIAGLPTWFQIRVNESGYTARKELCDIMVCMNASTFKDDLKVPKKGGWFIYNSDLNVSEELLREDVQNIPVSFKPLLKGLTDSVKLKKLLTNMLYVGVLAELLDISDQAINEALATQFLGKEHLIELNRNTIDAGKNFVKNELSSLTCPFKVEPRPNKNKDQILIDGNTASAIGWLYGGCQFVSWYPITPASSTVEAFINYTKKLNYKDAAIVQAEDELAAVGMIVGAGWAGARSLTATSGPGISLMSETAGLAYFAEIPCVIWNVQRGGPSTGLPTRTMQGDINACAKLSHGDTEHVLLFPSDPKECFEFGQVSLDLAERLQTLVIVMSDLDIGMNICMSDEFQFPTTPFDRGKVLTAKDLEKMESFARYKDSDGDGIPYRTLPGTEHANAAYFTRGTGHDENAMYSENPEIYKATQDRLKEKLRTNTHLLPAPEVHKRSDASVGVIAFGSTHVCMGETRDILENDGLSTSYLRIRSFPFSQDVEDFINSHSKVYVVEQNRDGQMKQLLLERYPKAAEKIASILSYDGLPVTALNIATQILEKGESSNG